MEGYTGQHRGGGELAPEGSREGDIELPVKGELPRGRREGHHGYQTAQACGRVQDALGKLAGARK